MDPMTFALARNTVKFYACSGCWGELDSPIPTSDGGFLVLCRRCKEETPGYVSQRYVERRRSESIGEEREVKRMLIKVGVLPDPLAGKSKADLIRELGY